MSVIGEPQSFKVHPYFVDAIQFTGKNGKAVSAFAQGRCLTVRNGGNWVRIVPAEDVPTVKVPNRGFVVWTHSELLIMHEDDFHHNFLIGKKNEVLPREA